MVMLERRQVISTFFFACLMEIIKTVELLAICRTSGCTVASGVVGIIVVVVGGICNRSQMRTSKFTLLIFGVSIDLDPG